MQDLYKHFSQSIAWNALESIVYQGLLLGHQLLLFNVTPQTMYGLIGTFFSITYLVVMVTNFGLDISLAPFFTFATQSKQHFKKFFFVQLIPECCIIICMLLLMIGTHLFIQSWQPPYNVSLLLLLIIGCLIFFEGAKKTLRMILQLSCLTHKTALVEIASIITYTSSVWTLYLMGYPISLYLVFIPMLIVSALSSILLFVFVLDYYKTLPDATLPSTATMQWRILHSRFFNFLNQAGHMAFSSNFLVPFFALFFGLSQAGLLKLVATIAHTMSNILQKAFGISSSIILSHLKNKSAQTNQDAFFMITNNIHQTLYGIILFFIINHKTIMHITAIPNHGTTYIIAYLFLIISFSENFFIAYEKFFITHEKAHYLCLFNFFIMGLLVLTITHAHLFSQTILLLIIIAIRIFAFSTLSLLSFYQWRIKPAIAIKPTYLAGSFIISIVFFMLTRLV